MTTLTDRLKALGVEAPKVELVEKWVADWKAASAESDYPVPHGPYQVPRNLADAALDELVGVVEEMHEKYAVVGRLSGDLAHHNTLLIGRCESLEDALARYRERNGKLVEQAGDWQLRAEAGADALLITEEKLAKRMDYEHSALKELNELLNAALARAEATEKALEGARNRADNWKQAAYDNAAECEAVRKELVEKTIEARQETHLAIIKRQDAERLLAERDGQRCETCAKQDSERCPVHDVYGEYNEWVHQTPPDFCCIHYQPRPGAGS